MRELSVVIWDGTSYFVESCDYTLGEGEKLAFKGGFIECCQYCDMKNEEI